MFIFLFIVHANVARTWVWTWTWTQAEEVGGLAIRRKTNSGLAFSKLSTKVSR
jgi:hypothetical protein